MSGGTILTPARDWCPSPLADSVEAVQNYQPVSATCELLAKQHGASHGFEQPIRAQSILHITKFKDTSHLSHCTSLKMAKLH